MQYKLKDKIEITEEFLSELISKSWQETESIQQQINNLDTSDKIGSDVIKLLKNICTGYYVLIGCLEAIIEAPETVAQSIKNADKAYTVETEPDILNRFGAEDLCAEQPTSSEATGAEIKQDFEPFEYFVDFDEPSGEPLTDKDLYT